MTEKEVAEQIERSMQAWEEEKKAHSFNSSRGSSSGTGTFMLFMILVLLAAILFRL